ncbi:hypothetical protein QOT17_006823 [Balamuthia mandrillaris]
MRSCFIGFVLWACVFLFVPTCAQPADSVELFVDGNSPCTSLCSEADPYQTITDALADPRQANKTVVLYLSPGVYAVVQDEFGDDIDTAPLFLIGQGNQRSEVVVEACQLQLSGHPVAFVDLTLKGTCAGLILSADVDLELRNVHVYSELEAAQGIVASGNLVTTDVQFRNIAFALQVTGFYKEWLSYGTLNFENLSPSDAAVRITSSGTRWQSYGPVLFRNIHGLALALTSTATWVSHSKVIFENSRNAIWLLEQARWTQRGPVTFRNNNPVLVEFIYGTDPVEHFERDQHLVFVKFATWMSEAPIILTNNNVQTQALVKLAQSGTIQTTHTIQFQGASDIFHCSGSSYLYTAEGCGNINCDCQQSLETPVLQWLISSSYLRLPASSFPSSTPVEGDEEETQVVVIARPEPVFSIGFAPSSSFFIMEDFEVVIETAGSNDRHLLRFEDEPIVFPSEEDRVEIHFTVSNMKAAKGSPFSLTIQPSNATTAYQPPLYFVSTEGGIVDVLEEVNPETEQVVSSKNLTALTWNNHTSDDNNTNNSTFIFSSTFDNGASIRIAFQTVNRNESVQLLDETTFVPSEDLDSLKWSLSIENWPFSSSPSPSSSHVLRLELALESGDSEWFGSSDVRITPLPQQRRDGEQPQKAVHEQRLVAENSAAIFRALNFAWKDEDYTTSAPVSVELFLSSSFSFATARFTFPPFEQRIEYDPDLSVVLSSTDGEGNEDGEDADDELWWKILVPVLLVTALVVVVVASITFHFRRKIAVKRRRMKFSPQHSELP